MAIENSPTQQARRLMDLPRSSTTAAATFHHDTGSLHPLRAGDPARGSGSFLIRNAPACAPW